MPTGDQLSGNFLKLERKYFRAQRFRGGNRSDFQPTGAGLPLLICNDFAVITNYAKFANAGLVTRDQTVSELPIPHSAFPISLSGTVLAKQFTNGNVLPGQTVNSGGNSGR